MSLQFLQALEVGGVTLPHLTPDIVGLARQLFELALDCVITLLELAATNVGHLGSLRGGLSGSFWHGVLLTLRNHSRDNCIILRGIRFVVT